MRGDRANSGGWVSASDLAEYAYCPRAWWYRKHPPARGPSIESQRSSVAGALYHRRQLAALESRERWGWRWAVLAAVAVMVLTALILLGGSA